VDNKPAVPAERARFEAKGMELISITHEDGFLEERINFKGRDYPGIQMTRSLGDLAVKDYGIIAEPEVVEWSLEGCSSSGAYLFVACDGVFDFLESAEVAKIILDSIKSGENLRQACKRVLKMSRDAWEENEGGYCDDITMILMPVGGGAGSRPFVSRTSTGGEGCCAGVQKSCAIS